MQDLNSWIADHLCKVILTNQLVQALDDELSLLRLLLVDNCLIGFLDPITNKRANNMHLKWLVEDLELSLLRELISSRDEGLVCTV